MKWTISPKNTNYHNSSYEMGNLNGPITIQEIEIYSLKLLQKKSLGLYGFIGEFYQIFKELKSILIQSLLENKEETVSNLF